MMGDVALPDIDAIREARVRIAPHVRVTPVMRVEALDAVLGAELFLKCENFQKVGAFKARGACNAVFALSDEAARRGVVTHSSGNHGAALAYAAQRRGIAAWIVMPSNSAKVKIENVRRLGATIRYSGPDAASRAAVCAEVERETGATMIHPFDNAAVIAGQGTAVLELLADAPELDAVVAPCGGGGLLSGTSIAARGLSPSIRIWGAEPANADDASRSFRSGRIEPLPAKTTIADGLRTPLAERTLAAIRANADALETCSEEAIVRAMRMMFERMKIVVEPSGAVPLACLLERRYPAAGLRIGVIVSGGNVDLDRLPWQDGG